MLLPLLPGEAGVLGHLTLHVPREGLLIQAQEDLPFWERKRAGSTLGMSKLPREGDKNPGCLRPFCFNSFVESQRVARCESPNESQLVLLTFFVARVFTGIALQHAGRPGLLGGEEGWQLPGTGRVNCGAQASKSTNLREQAHADTPHRLIKKTKTKNNKMLMVENVKKV